MRRVCLAVAVLIGLLACVHAAAPRATAFDGGEWSETHKVKAAKAAPLAAGYTKELVKEGKGGLPKSGQSVTVHCTGFGALAAARPATFPRALAAL